MHETRSELLERYLNGQEIIAWDGYRNGQPVLYMPRYGEDPFPWQLHSDTGPFRYADHEVSVSSRRYPVGATS